MNATDCAACLGCWPDPTGRIADLGPAILYLHDDQFFPGWSVLVLKRHATELYELARDERSALIEVVSRVARVLAVTYDARKMNYALLGNQIPHVHWHLMPRLTADPAPDSPVWSVRHAPLRLAPAELVARAAAIRQALLA